MSSRRRLVTRLALTLQTAVFLGLSVAAGAVAVGDLTQAWDIRRLAAIARRIEHREPVSMKTVDQSLALIDNLSRSPRCDDRANRASISISVVAQAAQNQAHDFEAWSGGLARLIRIVHHGLECTPSNGSFWSLLALAERAAAPSGERIGALMLVAERLAPSEALSLRTRAEVWRTNPWFEGPVALARTRDLQTVLVQARPWDAARMLRDVVPVVEAEARRYLQTQPASRTAALSWAGLFAEPSEPKAAAGFDGLFPKTSP